ncbi:unnamed protein product [Dicrocoelium dendriticum]|nr:unnamed protein product [Dicrocoelium dendriticum]
MHTSDSDFSCCGLLILFYLSPLQAMIERNDPKLKYVNDGAAIRNPFAVDRRVQLAYLTALLCVRTADGGYACKGCDRTTARLRPMQQHLLSHSASKFNLCVRCLKGFNDKYDMKRHTRKHTLVRPYVCPECGRSFSQRCSLEGHRKKIHKIRLGYSRNQRREAVRVCECCGFACCDTAQMLAHVVQLHPDSSSLPRLRRQLVRQEERKRCCLQSTRSTTEHSAMFDTFTNTCTGFVASTSCNDLNAVTSSGVKPEATAETPRTKIVEFNRMEYPYSFHASDTPLMYT